MVKFFLFTVIKKRGDLLTMLQKASMRSRYVYSLLLIMIPLLIFSVIIYTSTQASSMQYINSSSLQNFTYASENLSSLIGRLDYAAKTAFSIENEIQVDERGNIKILSDNSLCAALHSLEERISPEVTALFYIKGDKHIYSSQGCMLYGNYEQAYLLDYNLSLSAIYTHLQKISDPALWPLTSSYDRSALSGLVYAIPFPTETAGKAVLCFVLSDDVIADQFANYMGDLPGSLYLFDGWNELLYMDTQNYERIPDNHLIRVRGTGVLSYQYMDQEWMLMRSSNSSLGFYWIMATPRADFYADMEGSQRLMLTLIMALLILMLILILLIAFFNYKPIQDLLYHVTGQRDSSRTNELEVIRGAYDQTADELENLASHLNEITPIVAQQFVSRLVFGHLSNAHDIKALASRAGMDFSQPLNLVMYLTIPRQKAERHLEQSAMIASRFNLVDAYVAMGDLPTENALCFIINFDAPPDQIDQRAEEYARLLYEYMEQNGAMPEMIGIGNAYSDPLKMNESFVEACAAVQLSPSSAHWWRYNAGAADTLATSSDGFHGLSLISLSLLSEGIHRGDKPTALRALHDMLQNISEITHSLVFYRFCCSELLTAVIRQADSLNLPISKGRVQQLVAFTAPDDFVQESTRLVEELCDAMKQRISDDDQRLKQDLMDYILANFKRPDLSIQTVADETGIRKTQITTLLKEETGQGFVQYVSYLRLNEFKRLLLQSDETIRDLVLQIGYNDVPNFLRKFKSIEGVTPGQYRQQHGKK